MFLLSKLNVKVRGAQFTKAVSKPASRACNADFGVMVFFSISEEMLKMHADMQHGTFMAESGE